MRRRPRGALDARPPNAVPDQSALLGRAEDRRKKECQLDRAFRDKERRKELFREYKEIEMLYEIIAPDAFLRPYLGDTPRSPAFTRWCAIPRPAHICGPAFQRKPNARVRRRIGAAMERSQTDYVTIDRL